MSTATENVEPTHQAAEDLQSGYSRERYTVPEDDMDVLALDVNEEPEDTHDKKCVMTWSKKATRLRSIT